jgi:histidine triad (HIT) family protein
MSQEKTIFEKIIAGEIPSYKIYEDDHTFAFLDINPASHGHTLVVPKRPFEHLLVMPDDVAAALIQSTKKVAEAIKKATNAGGIKLIMNNGAAAGQEVFHAHMHVIPRHENDGVIPGRYKKYKGDEATIIAHAISAEIK